MEFRSPDKLRSMRYGFVNVDGLKIFCRQAGADTSPALILLHGFPTSSHMFRDLIPALADDYRVVAPDLPGFGFSDAPDRAQFKYTFDHLTDVIDRFTTVERLNRYAIYVFDYGAPVGFRLATRHPERITAIISQNGNAYEEGLSEGWNPIQRYWKEPTSENRAALRDFLKPEATKWQYMHGVQDESMVAPESYTLDSALLARRGNDEIQLDLFLDYASNVALYPKFQEYLRKWQPPLLAVWGKNDPFFLPSGAETFKRDDPNADVKFFDTGHFALETHHAAIAAAIRDFLGRRWPKQAARRGARGPARHGDVRVVDEAHVGLKARVYICESLGYHNYGDPWREQRYGGDREPRHARSRPRAARGSAAGHPAIKTMNNARLILIMVSLLIA